MRHHQRHDLGLYGNPKVGKTNTKQMFVTQYLNLYFKTI